MKTRLLRVKHNEPSRVVFLKHKPQVSKEVAAQWVKKIIKSCKNITHIVVASRLMSRHFRIYNYTPIYYELDGYSDVMRKNINYGYKSKLEKRNRLDPTDGRNIFPNFM